MQQSGLFIDTQDDQWKAPAEKTIEIEIEPQLGYDEDWNGVAYKKKQMDLPFFVKNIGDSSFTTDQMTSEVTALYGRSCVMVFSYRLDQFYVCNVEIAPNEITPYDVFLVDFKINKDVARFDSQSDSPNMVMELKCTHEQLKEEDVKQKVDGAALLWFGQRYKNDKKTVVLYVRNNDAYKDMLKTSTEFTNRINGVERYARIYAQNKRHFILERVHITLPLLLDSSNVKYTTNVAEMNAGPYTIPLLQSGLYESRATINTDANNENNFTVLAYIELPYLKFPALKDTDDNWEFASLDERLYLQRYIPCKEAESNETFTFVVGKITIALRQPEIRIVDFQTHSIYGDFQELFIATAVYLLTKESYPTGLAETFTEGIVVQTDDDYVQHWIRLGFGYSEYDKFFNRYTLKNEATLPIVDNARMQKYNNEKVLELLRAAKDDVAELTYVLNSIYFFD